MQAHLRALLVLRPALVLLRLLFPWSAEDPQVPASPHPSPCADYTQCVDARLPPDTPVCGLSGFLSCCGTLQHTTLFACALCCGLVLHAGQLCSSVEFEAALARHSAT